MQNEKGRGPQRGRIKMNHEIAMAAALDAGNRSKKAGGRKIWSVDDWNVACDTYDRLMGQPPDAKATR